MGRIFKLLIFFITTVILYGVYYFGVPLLLNNYLTDDFLTKYAYENYGYKIDVQNSKFKVGYSPSVIFKSERVVLLNNDGSDALKITGLNTDIKILPLLFKNFELKRFDAKDLNVNFVFTNEKIFQIGQYPVLFSENQLFNLNKLSSQIDNYCINLKDENQNKIIKLDGKNFYIENFVKNKLLKISSDAVLLVNNKKSDIGINADIELSANKLSKRKFNIDAKIVNLDLSDFSVYANVFSKGKIKSLSGILNLNSTTEVVNDENILKTVSDITNLGVYNNDLATSVYYKNKLDINSSTGILDNGILINDFKISGVGINVLAHGLVKDLNSNLPFLDLQIEVKDSKAENLLQLSPGEPDLNPDINLLIMKRAGFWGNANGNIKIKGRADYPNVNGKISIKDAYMVTPIKNAPKAVINLDFIGDKMKMDVVVPTSVNEKVLVKGDVILDKDRTADLYITSSKNVDLKTAQIVLNPLHEILRFDIGPVPIMNISGNGGINLHVTGTRKNPYAWGKFWFNNAEVSFNDVKNMLLKKGAGELEFQDQSTYFKTKTAFLNGKPVSIEGSCSLFGDLDFKISAKNQELGKLLKIVQTSPMLVDIKNLAEPVEKASGLVNLDLNLTGQVKDINNIVFNKTLFAKGSLNLLSDHLKLKGMNVWVQNVLGVINFNNLDIDLNLKSKINNSVLKISGDIKNDISNIQVFSDKFIMADGLKLLPVNIPYSGDFEKVATSFAAKYIGSINNIDFNKLEITGKIYSDKNVKSSIAINETSYELRNGKFKLPLLNGYFNSNPFSIKAFVTDIFSSKRNINGYCKFSNFDLNLLRNNELLSVLPKEFSDQIKEITSITGKVDLSARMQNNSLNVFTTLDDIGLVYKGMNILVSSGNILLRNNALNINKLNAVIDEMPLFVNGKIFNIFRDPGLNLFVNTKPSQNFIDQIFNKNSLYPVKIKGDVMLSSNIEGTLKALNIKTVLDIAENSSIYYMGATLGDAENPVKITVDETYYPNKINIHNFEYDKFILSQNAKPVLNPQLKASGVLRLLNNNIIEFQNFTIKTEAPTDAKIFNIIFRKPFMKQGVFTSDLILNGTSVAPEILGDFNITSIAVPFFDSTIKDINLNFKPEKIDVISKGMVLNNEIQIDAILKNNFTPPYVVEDLNLSLVDLNINKIADAVRDIEADSARNISSFKDTSQLDLSRFIINNANIKANKIAVRNINADSFSANLKLSDKNVLEVNDFKFYIAEGSVNGKLNHNLNTFKTDLSVKLNNANALVMSEALFDLKGQVYGSVNGNFDLSCDGSSQETCFKTLTGNGKFDITDGRMPKLGSLEYLLKAGNLFKGGLTGLSINSIIDLITPLKTGDFESIYGSVNLTGGIADNIQIFSKGKDLNMYMKGSYNILTSVADMQIFGSLSKNITTVFGKIKNASLNTLFNTIPGVNSSDEAILMQTDVSKIPNIQNVTDIFRIFAVDINGDINGENYVRSFEWVK